MNLPNTLMFLLLVANPVAAEEPAPLVLDDKEYFATPGLNVLVFSNWYDGLFSDSKISGIELIHHGVRTATNGDVRLNATPEQWDLIPQFVERKVDRRNKSIEAVLRYPQYNFDYSIRARIDGDDIIVTVHMPRELPPELAGKAGLNIEFLPSAYFEKSWIMDDRSGLLPLYPTGAKEQNDAVAPEPLARGSRLVLAPDDPERRVSISAEFAELSLYDGRSKAQNGWFVVRSLLPANRSGKVLQWTLHASRRADWLRDPVIAHSQVGYHPAQQKVAVIELDANDQRPFDAKLLRIGDNGQAELIMQAKPEEWGAYHRYNYRQFDFSAVSVEGIFVLEYGRVRTAPFRIASDIFSDVWQPTLDIFMPVQMDHVLVNEAYRVWHGASHLDDALQAPVNHEHFDLYAQGPTTDTQYKPGEPIPGLNIGGWYDAGDYDIRTQTQYYVVNNLVNVWETFALKRDVTLVDYERKYVDLHVPDDKPDLLQQIKHGTLALIAQYRAVGHAIPGIIVPDISQYTHLGDGLTMTDNLVYNPELGPLESNGVESGVFDDRWAFTSRSSALNFGSMAALAAASRALRGFDDALAEESLQTAIEAWDDEQASGPHLFRHGNTTGGPLASEEMKAAVELLVTTGDSRYARRFLEYIPELERDFGRHAMLAVRAMPYLNDEYDEKIRKLTRAYVKSMAEMQQANPFGVVITEGGWAGNGTVVAMAMNHYYLHKAFPDLVNREAVVRGLNYLFGTHPGSDISFVSAVGAQSKKVAYGMNRADFSFIAGGIVPGVLILKPDFPENKEDWPFLWGENEYVISVASSYLFLANAAAELFDSR